MKTGNGDSYIFRGSSYWKLTADSVAPGYPRTIAQDWPGLPNDLDAAFRQVGFPGRHVIFAWTAVWNTGRGCLDFC